MKISGRKSYVTIETSEYTCTFGGDLCGDGFGADPLSIRWDKLPDDQSDASLIRVIREVWEECKDKKEKVHFDFFKVKDLLEVLNMLPDRIGTISDVNDDGFIWHLPNGILTRVYLTNIPPKKPTYPRIIEWYIGYSYLKNGKEIALSHSHPDLHQIFEKLVDIQDGNTFWVIKTNAFGKETPPLIMGKEEFEKIKNKDKYRIF